MPDEPVQRIHCPIQGNYDFQPCDPAEVEPLAEHLRAAAPVAEAIRFPRGTLLPDGRLDLCKQNLGPAGCRLVTEALAGNAWVKSLMLGTDGIGDVGAADVARLVEQNSHLEVVYLGCNHITGSGAGQLCAALEENTSVTGLWLKRNPIGPEGARSVARMLRHNTTIRTLDLVNTGIGSEGLALVLDALIEANRSVERLYLGGNDLDAEDMLPIATLLRDNPRIRSLFLNVNRPGDTGVEFLAAALVENTTLEELGLASCGLTGAGATSLFTALARHPALLDLDLGYSPSTRVLGAEPNTLGADGTSAVVAFLARNPPLRRLNLKRAGLDPSAGDRIAEALQANVHLVELFLDGKEDRRIRTLLDRNAAGSDPRGLCGDVAMIRSVYRTAREAPPPVQRSNG